MDLGFDRRAGISDYSGQRELSGRPLRRTIRAPYRRAATFSNGEHAEAQRSDSEWGYIVVRAPNELGWQTTMGVTATSEAAKRKLQLELVASERYGIEVTLAEIVPVEYRMFADGG